MDSEEFRRHGKQMIDFITGYLDNIRERPVLPSVEPGYLRNLIPENAPLNPESWTEIFKDIERVVMPGVTHWQSPRFHAYFPAGSSYPSILGELLSAGISVVGFHWMSSPACTELEVVVMDWLAKLLHLPDFFLSTTEGPGGGLIQGTASEATLVCFLAAQEKTLRRVKRIHPEWDDSYIRGRMVAYSSVHSNSSIEKAGRLSSMRLRLLDTDNKCRIRGASLQKAIAEDIADGYIPTFVCAAMGTTATCASDNLAEIGPLCEKYDMWLHVDAAYAGAALVCPEYHHLLQGIEYSDSFVFNPHKWLLVNFDCSALWVRDSNRITDVLGVDRIYLQHQKEGSLSAPDFRNWEIPLGRRFRSLKLWFTLRTYGVTGLQTYIRDQVRLAKEFEELVLLDPRFEIVAEVTMALVCFRMKGSNNLSKRLLSRLTARKKIYMIAGELNGTIFLRFAVSSRLCKSEDIAFAWNEIQEQAAQVLAKDQDEDLEMSESVAKRAVEEELFIRMKEEHFIESFENLQVSLNGLSCGR